MDETARNGEVPCGSMFQDSRPRATRSVVEGVTASQW